jgi:hypothetical protein
MMPGMIYENHILVTLFFKPRVCDGLENQVIPYYVDYNSYRDTFPLKDEM